jgi:hypothetical protein
MSSQKRKPLDTAALAAASVQQPDPVELATAKPVVEPPKRAGGPRAGRVQIQGYFPEDTRRELKLLAVQKDRTVEDLLGEAILDVLAKYGTAVN